MDSIANSLSTLPAFAAYFSVAAALTAVFTLIYSHLTPYSEIKLIRSGNVAAATALTGALLGFVISLCAIISQSATLLDVSLWGLIALVVQVAGFLVVRAIFRGLPEAIAEGQLAEAVFLAGLSVGLGLLVAACMIG